MTDSDNKSLGANTSTNNQNLFALSSASKMNKSKNKNKIPRGATGTMPGKSSNNPNKPKTVIGFKEKPKDNETKPNIDQKDNNNPADDEDYEVEVTEPPKEQLTQEAENEDKMHPNAKLTKEEQCDIDKDDIEYLKPDLDEQRRRESVVLDEDGEEFQEIQKQREERIKVDQLRKENQNDKNVEADDAEYKVDLDGMDDLTMLPNLSGMTRLVTDPMKDNDTENKEDNSNEVAMLPNLSGLSRLQTDPMNDNEQENANNVNKPLENTQNKDETIKHIPVRVNSNDPNDGGYEDEEFTMDAMEDLTMLPNLSGMTRLQTDPMNDNEPIENKENENTVDAMEDLTMLPNLSGMTRLQTDPMNDNETNNDKEDNDDLGDLTALGNLSGLSRLTTDPVQNPQDSNDGTIEEKPKEDDDLGDLAALGNLTGLSRLTTDPMQTPDDNNANANSNSNALTDK
eukprot:CAMPEP_0201595944 /NCGR_PEP_ID=MMETSP0190_2-20130828/192780_1 /ASSEMBLY_ACC=CAM_ASM_000263 /TAXON_ID=37353 /ORGANISM="Rosalina sp." /LENGTH=454 /DNA_ID=CAMNT_0048056103 /DNA_START=110 /DNA_END=1474 /DNA_ORIENTATION=+